MASDLQVRHSAHAPDGVRNHPIVVGYFVGAVARSSEPYYVKSLITSGSVAHLDQINYSQGAVHDGHCSLADPEADLNLAFTAEQSVSGRADSPRSRFRGNFHQLKELKRRYPNLKVILSLEGRASDFAFDAQPQNRQRFVASCIDTFIRGHFAQGVTQSRVFDGIDVDWESPQAQDAENFNALLEEFRRQMNKVRRGLLLTVAVGDDPGVLPGTDFVRLAKAVDEVGVMNYDYAGPWNARTGFVAPLFLRADSPHEYTNSIETSIAKYEAAGIPREKLLMGLPFYGYSWTGVEKTNNGLFQQGRGVHGDKPYHAIRGFAGSFTAYREPRSRAPWLYDGETFWTFEDPISIGFKASYAANLHLRGLMIWELSGDTTDAELLNAAYDSLRHPLDAAQFAPPEGAAPEAGDAAAKHP